MQAAANYIANRCFKEALNVLNSMAASERNAGWCVFTVGLRTRESGIILLPGTMPTVRWQWSGAIWNTAS
ncbi:MAG: hypothetical protein V8S31_04245 [Lachnospiraceae bacterium]